MSDIINLSHIEETSLIYGPGVRFVIWTQGCSIRCKGCWNKDTWSFSPKMLLPVNELYEKVIKVLPYIEGITILGGEPLDQYVPILEFVKFLRTNTNLSIILYTGYTLKEIKSMNKTRILDYIDIIITGRYIEKLRTLDEGLIGSSNQKIFFLTGRYSKKDLVEQNEIEISIEEYGQINFYGFLSDSEVKELYR